MKQNGRRLLCLLCSLAVMLSALPAVPLKAEGAAGAGDRTAGQKNSMEGAGSGSETEAPGEKEEELEIRIEADMETEAESGRTEALSGNDGTETDLSGNDDKETDTEPPGDGGIGTDAGFPGSDGMETDTDTGLSDSDGTETAAGTSDNGNGGMETGADLLENGGMEEPVSFFSAESSYTDAKGNVFTYVLDADGNAAITGIAASGRALAIPERIGGVPVAAVSGNDSCVVSNPETFLPSLYVGCGTVGAYAFSGLSIGTLTIGAGAACFLESAGSTDTSHYWMQFAGASVGTLRYEAVDLKAGHTAGAGLTNYMYGPFDGAVIGGLEIGTGVASIPEYLLYNAKMDIGDLEIDVPEIGAYAFSGADISIGTLAIGEEVSAFREDYYSSDVSHYWRQFSGASIGTLRYHAPDLRVVHTAGVGLTNYMYGPFDGAVIGGLEIGAGVASIPEYLLYNAKMSIGDLEIHVPEIGAYAFSGADISIGMLAIGEEVSAFCEDYYSSDTSHDWKQFAGASIGTLRYHAPDLQVVHTAGVGLTNYMYGPFDGAVIGGLEISGGVASIPEYLLYNAKMEIGELEIHALSVGAYAFSGADISIGTLTIGEEVSVFHEDYYSSDTAHHWEQFSGASIGTLRLLAPGLVTGHTAEAGLTNYIYPPFRGASIGTLTIGAGVEAVPEYFVHQAVLSMEEFEIHVPEIGAYAFAGAGISFGTLTLGKEVAELKQCHFSGGSYHYWNQFMECKVGCLVFSADEAVTVNDIAAYGAYSTYIYGPFQKAEVGGLVITENVARIPDYLFYNAKAELDSVHLDMPLVGAQAFMGGDISIGTLTVGEDVTNFAAAGYGGSSYRYWNQFNGADIGTVHYNAVSAGLDRFSGSVTYFNSPFYKTRIGTLHFGDAVESIPPYCFHEAVLEQEALAIHAGVIGSGAFYSANISVGTLTVGEEVGELAFMKSGSSCYFRQFGGMEIGTLVYEAKEAQTGTDCDSGPFDKASIGSLELGGGVAVIPHYLFYNAEMALGDFTVNVPVIGYYSFYGRNITFGTLTVGEDVRSFPVNPSGYSRAFNYCTVDLLCYNATAARLDKLGSGVYGPFAEYAKVKDLVIGENVTTIPYGCFRGAALELEELTIENAAVGYKAFNGSRISIGTLNIGKAAGYDGTVSDEISCFGNAKIGTLNYSSNAVNPAWCSGTGGKGMFASSSIGQLNIGEAVEEIPAFWFRGAAVRQEELTVPCAWGCYAFYSSSIEVGTLTLNGDVEEICCLGANNYGFRGNTIGTVVYDIPAAAYHADASGSYGIFYGASVTKLVIGERVRYLDDRLLRGSSFESCVVYPVEASEEFLAQGFSNSYLPSSTKLHIHHNSGFAAYFAAKATNKDWMCEDCYEVSYGEKAYDEESGEYMIEVIRRCLVCGYGEGGTEALDESYDVRISIPVEIPLAFSEEEKAYEGTGEVYAYGRLGNAYGGVRLTVDAGAEGYGAAEMDGKKVDVSPYLAAGFRSGDAAAFTPGQVSGNEKALSDGDMDAVCKDFLEVSVQGAAFLRSGAGEYRIPVPIRIEFY